MNSKRIAHAPSTQFPVVDDCLQIGGIALTQLAEQVGSTPFYAYDRTLMTQRVKLLRQYLPAAVHLHYAIKANPMPAVVQHLAGLVDGLDVASAGELKGGSRVRHRCRRHQLRRARQDRRGPGCSGSCKHHRQS
jgi:diaminopimelate decarboxylase